MATARAQFPEVIISSRLVYQRMYLPIYLFIFFRLYSGLHLDFTYFTLFNNQMLVQQKCM